MEKEVAKIIEKDTGFIKKNDFKIKELNDSKCILEYDIKNDGLNPMGIVHGGILFGLSDTAAGILSSMDGRTPLTTNASINYLNPAVSGKIFAEAVILKRGKNIGYFEVKIKNEDDKIISTSYINFFYK